MENKADSGSTSTDIETTPKESTIDFVGQIGPTSPPSLENYYDLSHGERVAIIFSHIKYQLNTRRKLEERSGSDADAKRLEAVLQGKGFRVSIHTDLIYNDIINKLKEASKMENISCILVVVMTHGERSDHIYSYECSYPVGAVWAPFVASQTLIGVPKLFFFQACRGDKTDPGIAVTDSGDKPPEREEVVIEAPKNFPLMSDFLFMHSTYEGYYSWRESDGSWFVTALCQALEEDRADERDLLDSLTAVNAKVATEYKTTTLRKETDKKKQMPQIVSTLTKFLNFKKQSQSI